MLNTKQKAILKKLAVNEKVTVQIGNNGITDKIIASIEEVLKARELVKISYPHKLKSEREKAAAFLAEQTQSELIHVLGKTILLFRQNPSKPAISSRINEFST